MSSRIVVQTDQAPKAIGPYSQGIIANGFVYTAGQLGLDPITGKLVEGGVAAEAAQAMRNLSAILSAAGTSVANIVKTTIFLHDMADFPKVNEVYGQYFPSAPPARSTVGNLNLPLGAQIEIEVVAMIP
jgi:2-iminobutanoate/2-iminopropanoate deaminase